MTNPNEIPPTNESQPEKHRLESASVDLPGSAKEVVVSMDDKDIVIKPFDEKNIDAILVKLLKENEQESQGVGINDVENIAAKIKDKKEKIEEDIKNLKELFSPANHEIFLVGEESMKNLPEKTDLSAMIIANKSKELQSDLSQKGYEITMNGDKGFWAKSKNNNIKMYFMFGKEQHPNKEKNNQEKSKLAA